MVLGHKVCQDPPDLQATPLPDRTVWPESPGVLVCKGTEATLESQARKVRRVTPASTASVAHLLFLDLQELQDNLDSQGVPVLRVSKETEDSQEPLDHLDLLVSLGLKVLQDSMERRESQAMPSQSAA